MRSKSQPNVETKKRAVSLRLAGVTLAEVAKETGLSAPTVATLARAYEDGGWEAIESRRRGRPKSGSRLAAESSKTLRSAFLGERLPGKRFGPVFSAPDLVAWIRKQTAEQTDERAIMRRLANWNLPLPDSPLCAGTLSSSGESVLFWARGPRGEVFVMPSALPLTDEAYCSLFDCLDEYFPKGLEIDLQFAGLKYTPKLKDWLSRHLHFQLKSKGFNESTSTNVRGAPVPAPVATAASKTKKAISSHRLTHLERLEAEAIHIMREVVAEAENPVMLYSIGKDSAVMLHLAVKAFYPARIPFPLLHVDTTWKFQDMYRFRSQMQKEHDFKLLIHANEEGLAQGINPFTHGSQIHTDIMKTVALRQALDHYGFDVAFGGARRDEEKSRAKERIFSFRTKDHRWDPKNQRPELWNLYNVKKHKGESIRVFPISNWTELDIWQYIYLENIPIVPLYFSSPRPVVKRDGALIMVDDDRMPLSPGEVPMMKSVRFRTLGCYPLTGAVESTATSLEDIIQEMLLTKTSERQGRVIDHDSAASMEKKKQEGYF
jgi:sulfate adenylyltransferase subunit 2